jgi:hypothetical protein
MQKYVNLLAISHFNARLGVLLQGPLIPHMLPASVHCTAVNEFKGTTNLKYLCPAQ